VKPWTTYELAQQIRRNLRYFWAASESGLYAEAKALVRRRLARATRGRVGRRRRTTYAITPSGRRALRAWLARTSEMPRIQSEALVKVFFCESGSPADLLATIDTIEETSRSILAIGEVVAREFLEGRHALMERIHVSGLMFDFLWGWALHVERWAREARAEVRRWRDCAPDPRKVARARARFSDRLATRARSSRRSSRGTGGGRARPRGR
jgi:DNA-binding PadR family transcriptional regulator